MKLLLLIIGLGLANSFCNDAQPDDQLPTPWDIDTTKNDTTINKTDSLIGL